MFEYNFWEGQGIILVWAWNDIKGVTLREGWTGVTDRDIGIRSMLQEFLEVYPEPVLELGRELEFILLKILPVKFF